MDKIKNNYLCLKYLSCCNNKIRKEVLKGVNQELILTLCDCILNCLNGNIKLNDNDILKLKKYKKALRSLISRNQTIKKQRKILVQKGGYILPIIVPSILTALGSYLLKNE